MKVFCYFLALDLEKVDTEGSAHEIPRIMVILDDICALLGRIHWACSAIPYV